MPLLDAIEIHVLMTPAVQMLTVNLGMTLLYVLAPQAMPVIHLINDGVVKLNPAQPDPVVRMLNVLQTDEPQFAR